MMFTTFRTRVAALLLLGLSLWVSPQGHTAAIVERVNPRPRFLFAPGEYERFLGDVWTARRPALERLVGEIEQRGDKAWNERDLQLESQALIARIFLEGGDRARGEKYLQYARASLSYFLGQHTYERYRNSHDIITLGFRWLEAVALAHDWLYPYWSASERAAIDGWLKAEVDRWVDGNLMARASPSPFRNDAARGVSGLLLAGLTLFDEAGYESTGQKALSHAVPYYQEILKAHTYAGSGGGMAEGTYYGNFTAWSQVMATEALFTAAGHSDAYSRSPFFAGRLRYATYATWPGYITNQYNYRTSQLAPVFGDARRGPTGSSLYHRATILLLGKRLAGTAAAGAAYWVVNREETNRAYAAEWGLYDLLLWSPAVEPQRPSALAYREDTLGQIFARSDWSDDATWVSFNAGPHLDTHQHYDAGNLTIYRGTDLLVDSGSFDNFGSSHWYNYYARTVAHNTITVTDPAERWKGMWSGVPDNQVANDGGQRAQAPLTPAPTLDQYLANRAAYDHARIDRYGDGAWGFYAKSNLTNAYQNADFQSLRPDGTPNRPKVDYVGREVMYLRGSDERRDAVVVFDRVIATDASFRKAVLWHSREPFESPVAPSSSSAGERVFNPAPVFTFTAATSFAEGSLEKRGRLHLTALALDSMRVRQIGDRPSTGDAADHETFGVKHLHRHVKDFFVNDPSVNNPDKTLGALGRPEWPPFNPPELQWLWRDELTGGWGRTRLELEPAGPRIADQFLTVLVTSEYDDRRSPDVTLLRAADRSAAGVLFREGNRPQAVIFSAENSGGDLSAATVEIPATDADVTVVNLTPGTGYVVDNQPQGSGRRLVIAAAEGGSPADAAGMLRFSLNESAAPALRQAAHAAAVPGRASVAPVVGGDPATLGGGHTPVPAAADHPGALLVMPATPSEVAAWDAQLDELIRRGALRVTAVRPDPIVATRATERLQQYYGGVPITGAEVVRQKDSGRTVSMSGVLYRDIRADLQPTQSTAQVRELARQAGAPAGATTDPILTLLPVGADRERPARYVLAYEIRAQTGEGRSAFVIDAHTGRLLVRYEVRR